MLRVRVQYGKSLGKQKKTTEIEKHTTIQVLHFSFPDEVSIFRGNKTTAKAFQPSSFDGFA